MLLFLIQGKQVCLFDHALFVTLSLTNLGPSHCPVAIRLVSLLEPFLGPSDQYSCSLAHWATYQTAEAPIELNTCWLYLPTWSNLFPWERQNPAIFYQLVQTPHRAYPSATEIQAQRLPRSQASGQSHSICKQTLGISSLVLLKAYFVVFYYKFYFKFRKSNRWL